MFAMNKIVRAAIVLAFLTIGMLSPSRTAFASSASSASSHDDINKVQKSLRDKGLYHGHIDGVLGPQTREAIGEYQKSENLPKEVGQGIKKADSPESDRGDREKKQ
jgi:peptidoglycan hydrolase-like protein with peptidoglycan-binding domain